MEVKYMEITPGLADLWLKKSIGNPRWKSGKIVDNNRVSKIAKDIKNDNWFPNNNSIAFDSDGVLVDGHHRLSAIIKADKSVFSLVVFGLNKESQKHIDENRPRTVAQRLGVDNRAVAVANCHQWMKYGIATPVLTAEEASKFIYEHPLVYDAITLSSSGSSHPLAKKAGVVHGILCALECEVPSDFIQNFVKCVNSGFIVGIHESSTVVLRNMLLRATVRNRSDSINIDCATQSALSDFIDCIPRKNAYHVNRGVYFDRLNI